MVCTKKRTTFDGVSVIRREGKAIRVSHGKATPQKQRRSNSTSATAEQLHFRQDKMALFRNGEATPQVQRQSNSVFEKRMQLRIRHGKATSQAQWQSNSAFDKGR
ncbi:hypothetical protein Y032_0033g2754 [Ancylostoma ceylanicum]|uniref:Uncharacterized protein n=1 Tax=Ancylostoma ceylanicum TaxID=53326 RepID=A0A016UNY0_9BILA|nr:hypothetical protein Y032_0033g2754 [Ancylostoma ceylanicum]